MVKLRITLELDASIMCDFTEPDEVAWSYETILANPALFVGGELGDLLDKDVEVINLKFFKVLEDDSWEEV